MYAERAALAADLTALTEDQWATPSLCEGLTVREVLAHLTAETLDPAPRPPGTTSRHCGSDRQARMRLSRHLGTTPADTLARFCRVITTRADPRLPVPPILAELTAHGEHIRHPLAIPHPHDIRTLTQAAAPSAPTWRPAHPAD
ncbi:maleylpyruvate isomerase N-terminal domain-containing protein [Bailinhaonella thermotolerans]|uniref:maleylpyruvate isomerase N-terminal domain-containing protein n=1 Tax=Bailinhaonella thermotolerans TaxID=1070861 RepID=UPI00192A2F6D|nr:maleylpyruvate isomerase N-terminal domain-containing protein [Bailinhaonella thermotolerans]